MLHLLLWNLKQANVPISVQVYLDLNRPIDELYYEQYDNVAVMFASLTDYKLETEGDADMNDKFVLSILNEVISDFDRVCIWAYLNRKISMWYYVWLNKQVVPILYAPDKTAFPEKPENWL